MGTAGDLSYDPYDAEIDRDPYPVWKRLRDEAPLYRNEQYDFFALSRFEDVERSLRRLGPAIGRSLAVVLSENKMIYDFGPDADTIFAIGGGQVLLKGFGVEDIALYNGQVGMSQG